MTIIDYSSILDLRRLLNNYPINLVKMLTFSVYIYLFSRSCVSGGAFFLSGNFLPVGKVNLFHLNNSETAPSLRSLFPFGVFFIKVSLK